MANPRHVALAVILACERSNKNLQEQLNTRLDRSGLDQRDRNLAAEIAYGTVRHRLTLDSIIEAFSNLPMAKLRREVLEILRVGLYQMMFMERIPDRAAVDEAVKLTRRMRLASARGFVNAVLRKVARCVRYKPQPGAAERSVYLREGRWAVLDRDVLPPPSDTLGYISKAYSHPPWLVERWVGRFGEERTISICRHDNLSQPVYIRVNALRVERDELLERLRSAGVEAAPGALPCSIRLERAGQVTRLPGFEEGLFQVQDETAMRAAVMLDPRPGEEVLDLCAAPGGKTTHIAELMGDSGRVTAVDVSARRLALVEENCRRLGLKSVRCIEADATKAAGELGGPYDRIMLDVPCTNTGVLRRRVDVRWRLEESDITEMAEVQRSLLKTAAGLLKPGGVLVYSTCSIEREENEDVAGGAAELSFIEGKQEFRLPGDDGAEGGYVAALTRVPVG